MNLSRRAQKLKPSATIALNAKVQELKKQGLDVINLTVGEPDWDTFDPIKKAAIAALEKGVTKYTPAAGFPDLRKALVERIKADLGLQYDPSEAVIGMGAKHTIFNALQVLCDPGDEVIIPAPYWVSYPTMAELAEAKPVTPQCPKETSFKLTADILKRNLTAKTKVLILNSPNNPTGQVYTTQELKDLAAVLERTGIWVISDDIYDKMIYTGDAIAPHLALLSESLRPQILLANSLSKTYSMTGWRIGSLVGNKKVIEAVVNLQSQSATCAVSFAQMGAIEALTGDQKPVQESMKKLNQRRKLCLEALSGIEQLEVAESQGAFYLFPDVSQCFGSKSKSGKIINNSHDFAAALLEDEKVALVPGIEFGAEGFVRISYTVSEKGLIEAMNRLKRFCQQLTR
ncbi:MAG: pyridoxal phosphate-dependent aminotransferase [Oligoflexia bacterium]|nr:pyridoxal phosphate-dependent aminotransferase [Oligoflexia bacterium]